MIYYLYKITNTINDKIYIGQRVETNDRWQKHKSDAKRWANGMRKNRIILLDKKMAQYGIENFTYEEIACCQTLDQSNEIEILLIEQYDSHVSKGKGYNVALGGKNIVKIHSTETKEKIRQSLLGKKHTDERKKNQSKSHNGNSSWRKGKTQYPLDQIKTEWKLGARTKDLAVKFNVPLNTMRWYVSTWNKDMK